MVVHLDPDVEAKLARLARQRGLEKEALVQQAVTQLLDYNEWFIGEVDQGIADADRGDFVEHEDVRRIIDSRYPG